MRYSIKAIFIILLILIANSKIYSQSNDNTLIIGTKNTPPFAIKESDGSWSGITIDLWREIATDLGYQYRYQEHDLKGLIDGLQDGSLDAAVAALTITADRETKFDFTHSFYSTGLSIATITKGEGSLFKALSRVFSFQFMKLILALILILMVIGIIVWLFERKNNADQYGDSFLKGIGHSFWWSAVTMTTVGYGDISPKSVGGRIIGLLWMFAAIIIISSFTATITSVLTVSQLESPVRGPGDLPKVRIGSIDNSTAAQYLITRGINYKGYATPLDGLKAIEAGQIDAMVYDAPILRYLVNTMNSGNIRVLPQTFESQDYGIGLPADSPRREQINRVMLKKIHSPWWQETLRKYIGD